MFPEIAHFADFGFLLLRRMVACVFITSGWAISTEPKKRSKGIGMSKGLTMSLGLAELLASPGLLLGALARLSAFGMILIMRGDIQKKVFVWHKLLG